MLYSLDGGVEGTDQQHKEEQHLPHAEPSEALAEDPALHHRRRKGRGQDHRQDLRVRY